MGIQSYVIEAEVKEASFEHAEQEEFKKWKEKRKKWKKLIPSRTWRNGSRTMVPAPRAMMAASSTA